MVRNDFKWVTRSWFRTDRYIPMCFQGRKCIILIYVDNCIVLSKTKEGLEKTLEGISKNITMTDEGNIETYLGIQINHKP